MTTKDEIKLTIPYPYEWAYDCPYCGQTQGWTNYGFSKEDYDELHTCKRCRKEFKLGKTK